MEFSETNFLSIILDRSCRKIDRSYQKGNNKFFCQIKVRKEK